MKAQNIFGFFKSAILACLILSLSVPPQTAFAANETKSFEKILSESQSEMDLGKTMQGESVQKFADALIASNVSVHEIDGYVKSKLTAKEYAAYEKQSKVMMKGLDPEKMTPNEFSQVVTRALEVTQPKALTWSSCSTLTVGVLIAVAAVVVGIVAIAKRKIDKITEDGLYNDWQNKNSSINSTYNDTKSKLDDPQGYFNRKINSAKSSISSDESSIDNLEGRINSAQNSISSLRYELAHTDDEDEQSRLRSRINSYQSDIERYQREISDYQDDISDSYNDIDRYYSEKQRYLDPQVVINERAALEAWLPQALVSAEQNYQISLKDMPVNNEKIDRDNVKIAKTKKTLGIIAGVGGGASLAIILSSAGKCSM